MEEKFVGWLEMDSGFEQFGQIPAGISGAGSLG